MSFSRTTSILGVAGFPALGTVWAKILVVISYIGVLWAYTKRSLPRRLNPPEKTMAKQP